MTCRRGLLCAVVLAAAGAGAAPAPDLVLAIEGDGRVVWATPVAEGERFDVSFLHSAERCRWTHHFVVDRARGIRQTGSTMPCFGAGMPARSTDGTPVLLGDGGYLVAAPRVIGTLRMMNWRASGITLRFRSRDVPAGEYMPDFAVMTVRIEGRSPDR